MEQFAEEANINMQTCLLGHPQICGKLEGVCVCAKLAFPRARHRHLDGNMHVHRHTAAN